MNWDELTEREEQWFQDRWNEGAAMCVGLIRMAEAIRDRPQFQIALCSMCADGAPSLKRTRLITIEYCARCGDDGGATPSGGTWLYG